jgi:lsr operon transcriptional repressor
MSEKRITEEGRYAGLALAEEELVARVAWCYYHDGLTQNDIGERLGCRVEDLPPAGERPPVGVIRVQINSAMRAVWRWKPNYSSALA